MSLDDLILALHLLSSFALVGALTAFSIGLVALRGADTPGRVLAIASTIRLGQPAVQLGTAGTVVFGIWLALSVDAYSIGDLWVILAIVGWAAATEIGRRSGGPMTAAFARAEQLAAEEMRRESRGLTRAAGVLSLISVVGWLVAVGAMGGKI